MKKNDEYKRCKQCNKIIVGNSKAGLCDRCFNKDATKSVEIVGGSFAAWKLIVKPIIKRIMKRKQ